MPEFPTYPGVYIEEVPSGAQPIGGVATAITAFIGRARRGPVNEPFPIRTFAEFERFFGPLWPDSTMSYAVQHFFLNGGTDAIIVRVVHSGEARANGARKATGTLNGLDLEAANEGAWGNRVKMTVDHNTSDTSDPTLFNLTVALLNDRGAPSTALEPEIFQGVATDPTSPRFVRTVLAVDSAHLRAGTNVPAIRPAAGAGMLANGADGTGPDAADYEGSRAEGSGIFALDKADLFNLMCIPPFARDIDVSATTWAKALRYCKTRRAILIVDPPDPNRDWGEPAQVAAAGKAAAGAFALRDENAVLYYPYMQMADAVTGERQASFAPCGVVAGVIARTDARRGVWKAPAGLEATLTGVRQLTYGLNDDENDLLSSLGVNCLRTFAAAGPVIWGARTLAGADQLASEWKYLPVRRLGLFLEESLYRGLRWVVFEPNDEPLWAQIRQSVGVFLQKLFLQGAFQASKAAEAYFVKCDHETTTATDINQGRVNVLVGFAPLKPAEFIVIRISQEGMAVVS